MKTKMIVLSAALCLSSVMAQNSSTPTNRSAPRGGGGPVYSPDVQSDRKVTFWLRAQKAENVKVAGEWGGSPVDLEKGDDGVWSTTIGPLEPELYGYNFIVDGLRIADPGNPNLKPMRSPNTSILEIGGEPPLIHEMRKDVAKGTVSIHQYFSEALDSWRRLHVYTPPGYQKGESQYPILYLFHGAGDNDATWTVLGRANVILDNLLAEKKAKPIVIVMTDGHPIESRITGGVGPEMIQRNVKAFEKDLLEEVIPLVESTYRVKKERKSRAIAGLSMGGGQALHVGLNHPKQFGYVAGFSSYVIEPEKAEFAVFKENQTKPILVWTACGKEDFLIENAKQFSANLKEHGVNHEFLVTKGNHSWPVWRKYFAQFAPLLFRE